MAADAASSAGLPGRTGLETPSLSESQAQAGKPLLVALPMTAYVTCRWLPCMKPPSPRGAGSRERQGTRLVLHASRRSQLLNAWPHFQSIHGGVIFRYDAGGLSRES